MLERRGDLRYVQRDVDPSSGDVTLAMSPEHPQAAEMAGALEALRRDFVERFGREPGPQDSLLVDPDATEPAPLSSDAFDAMLDRLADGVDDPLIVCDRCFQYELQAVVVGAAGLEASL